ncbi:hypothetical protein CSOJ01_07571 [Colletotrichum sojae]|uniref:Uncharacterized protein n=1 Tax=Colletotrichum sojae TaxID=2175907 RepID=A0A8H6J8R2_9PEZI|nr:hypothetical protein CSOJ01_07571 [Colletotrichum sojae]
MDISTNTTTTITLARHAVGADWSWQRILRFRTILRFVRITIRLAARILLHLARLIPLPNLHIISALAEPLLLILQIALVWVAIQLLRIVVILLLLVRILVGLTIGPVVGLARSAWAQLAASPVPKLLGIKHEGVECSISRSSSCGGCLLQILFAGALVVFGLRLANSVVRKPGFRRSPETYAVVYLLGEGFPAILLAQVWWSCLV